MPLVIVRKQESAPPPPLVVIKRKSRESRWGKMLREIRVETGVSQRELSRRTGITRSIITRVESGKTAGFVTDIERIASVLGYELDLIYVGNKDGPITL